MENRQNYIRLLEQKRHNNREILKQLYSKIEMVLQENIDMELEIEHLRNVPDQNKTLVDLPVLVWRKIMGMLINPQNEIDVLSLASEELEKLLHSLLEGRPGLIKQENAFAILLKNFYLDRQDLLNCAETGAEELGIIASRTWHFLRHLKCDIIHMNSDEAIHDFKMGIEKKKCEQKIWTAFVGKIFNFSLHPKQCLSWKILKPLLLEYGKYFVNIRLYGVLKDSDGPYYPNHVLELLIDGNLQSLRFFLVQNTITTFYGLRPETNMRSMQTILSLWTNMSPLCTDSLTVSSKIAEALYNRYLSEYSIPMKTLRIWEFENNVPTSAKGIKKLLSVHNNQLSQIRELTVPTLPSVANSFRFAAHFPALSTLNMNSVNRNFIDEPEDVTIPKNFAIPTVRTFTYEWKENETFPNLRNLCAAFPSLRCFNMKASLHRQQLLDLMRPVLQRDRDVAEIFNRDFDVFQRICDDQSLVNSNIWEQVPRLNIVSLITELEEPRTEIRYWMIERYIRAFREVGGGGSSIRIERYLQTDWKLQQNLTWF